LLYRWNERNIKKQIAPLVDKIIYQDKNKGKGAALRTGIANITRYIVIIQDSDLEDEYETAKASEWNQFRNLDLTKIKKLLKSPILLDVRNLYDPGKTKSLGFTYEGVGRK